MCKSEPGEHNVTKVKGRWYFKEKVGVNRVK